LHGGASSELALAVEIEASPDARRLGLSIWIDTRQLQPGTPWQEQLEDVILKDLKFFAVSEMRRQRPSSSTDPTFAAI
jgi:hypothetical protein